MVTPGMTIITAFTGKKLFFFFPSSKIERLSQFLAEDSEIVHSSTAYFRALELDLSMVGGFTAFSSFVTLGFDVSHLLFLVIKWEGYSNLQSLVFQ